MSEKVILRKQDGFHAEIRRNFWLHMLTVPAILLTLHFKYIPMVGVAIAFQDFNPIWGISGNQFVGFDNFKYFFRGSQWFQITVNTL